MILKFWANWRKGTKSGDAVGAIDAGRTLYRECAMVRGFQIVTQNLSPASVAGTNENSPGHCVEQNLTVTGYKFQIETHGVEHVSYFCGNVLPSRS